MKLKRRSIAIDDELWTKIISMANAQNRSTSQYVRIILANHINKIGIKLKEKNQ